jgi:integrase
MTANTHRRSVTPATEKQTVARDMARRRPNAALRSREYLTSDEVERLITAAKQGRWGHRDATLLLVAYRHGLRASELTDLRWDQIDFSAANFQVRRAKKGTPATHPILGDELSGLRNPPGVTIFLFPRSSLLLECDNPSSKSPVEMPLR